VFVGPLIEAVLAVKISAVKLSIEESGIRWFEKCRGEAGRRPSGVLQPTRQMILRYLKAVLLWSLC